MAFGKFSRQAFVCLFYNLLLKLGRAGEGIAVRKVCSRVTVLGMWTMAGSFPDVDGLEGCEMGLGAICYSIV